jgi:hypothetical protein
MAQCLISEVQGQFYLYYGSYRKSVGLLGRGISLYLRRTTQTCVELDSNPRSQRFSRRSHFMP